MNDYGLGALAMPPWDEWFDPALAAERERRRMHLAQLGRHGDWDRRDGPGQQYRDSAQGQSVQGSGRPGSD